MRKTHTDKLHVCQNREGIKDVTHRQTYRQTQTYSYRCEHARLDVQRLRRLVLGHNGNRVVHPHWVTRVLTRCLKAYIKKKENMKMTVILTVIVLTNL